MNNAAAFVQWINTSPVIYRGGWTLLHSLWELAVVGGLLFAVLHLLEGASSRLRYLAATTALALMVLLPIFTFEILSLPTLSPTRTSGSSPTLPVDGLPSGREGSGRRVAAPTAGPLTGRNLGVANLGGEMSSPSLALAHLAMWLVPAVPWIVLSWAFGVLAFGIWHLGGWIATQRMRSLGVSSVEPELAGLLLNLSRRIGLTRSVLIAKSTLVQIPIVIGSLHPLILVPASILAGLPAAYLEAILVHELAHIRRHDYLINLLQTLVETLLFFHPAAWWASGQVRQEREHCCDEIAAEVCGDRRLYAEALVSVQELRAPEGIMLLAATGGGGSMFARIQRLIGSPQRPRYRRSTSLAAVLFSFGLLLVPLLHQRIFAQDSVIGPTPANTAHLEGNALPVSHAVPEGNPAQLGVGRRSRHLYILSVGDRIRLSVFREESLNTSQRIDGLGNISLALVGDIHVAGLSQSEARKAIEDAYKNTRALHEPVGVTMEIEEYSPRAVSIQGEVKNPGRFQLPIDGSLSVVELVMKAGGFTGIGQGGDVRIVRVNGPDGSKSVEHIDVQGIIEGRSAISPEDPALALAPNDIVYVPERIISHDGPSQNPPQTAPRPQALAQPATPAMVADNKLGAAILGPAAIDARWAHYPDYLTSMMRRIQTEWRRIVAKDERHSVSGSISVRFRMDSHGRIAAILDHTVKEVDAAAAGSCIAAIASQPSYGDWTPEMIAVLGDSQDLTLTFHFRFMQEPVVAAPLPVLSRSALPTQKFEVSNGNGPVAVNTISGESIWRGFATLRDGPSTFTADEIRYNRTTSTMTAAGHVVWASGSGRLFATSLVYNRQQQTLNAENVRVGVGPFLVTGLSAAGTLDQVEIHHAEIVYDKSGELHPARQVDAVVYSPGHYLRLAHPLTDGYEMKF